MHIYPTRNFLTFKNKINSPLDAAYIFLDHDIKISNSCSHTHTKKRVKTDISLHESGARRIRGYENVAGTRTHQSPMEQ